MKPGSNLVYFPSRLVRAAALLSNPVEELVGFDGKVLHGEEKALEPRPAVWRGFPNVEGLE